jgi:hypothetical protein
LICLPFTVMVSSASRVERRDFWNAVPCLVGVCGDCNGDLVVTILDALLAAQHAAALMILTGRQFSACNVIGALQPTRLPPCQSSTR